MKNKTLTIALICLIAIQGILLIYFWYTRLSLETFSVKQAVGDFSLQLAQSNLSPSEKEALSKKFAAQLTLSIGDYSQKNHVVLVNPSLIVTPINDATLAIEKDISKKMQNKS